MLRFIGLGVFGHLDCICILAPRKGPTDNKNGPTHGFFFFFWSLNLFMNMSNLFLSAISCRINAHNTTAKEKYPLLCVVTLLSCTLVGSNICIVAGPLVRRATGKSQVRYGSCMLATRQSFRRAAASDNQGRRSFFADNSPFAKPPNRGKLPWVPKVRFRRAWLP